MARKLNLVTPDIGTPDIDSPDGTYLDESAGVPGTPILAGEKNSIYYFFSKLMTTASIAFSGIVDNITTSQFFTALMRNSILLWNDGEDYLIGDKAIDEGVIWESINGTTGTPNKGNQPSLNQDKWVKVAAPLTTEDIIATGTLSVSWFDILATSDTSLGDNTVTVEDGNFIGQKVKIISDGTGFTNVTYTGKLSTGNNVISDGLSLDLEWDGVKWIANNVVTADYVSGSQRIIKKPNRYQAIYLDTTESYSDTLTVTTGTIGFAVSFASIESFTVPAHTNLTSLQSQNIGDTICTITTSTYNFTTRGTSGTFTVGTNLAGKSKVEGEY